MSVKFQTIIPSTMVPKPLNSGSQHIIRRRKIEVLPVNQTNYQFSGNNRIQFNISSASEFMDAQNSYLRFDFRAYGLDTEGKDDPLLSLATGGAHALFKTITIRLQNGTELVKVGTYNKWYGMTSGLTQSADHVESFGWMYGDSVGRFKSFDPRKTKYLHHSTMTADNIRYAELAAGGAATLVHRYLPLVPDNLNCLGGLVEDDVKATPIANLQAESGGFNAARVQACLNTSNDADLATPGVILSATLPLSILQMHSYLPLPYIQGGLQIEIELDNPVYALSSNDGITPGTSGVLDYAIYTPRMVCQFVQPSEEIMSQYLNLYKQNKLTYPYMKIQHYLNTDSGADATSSFVMHPNMRSAVLATTIVQNRNANTTTQTADADSNSHIYDCIGTTIKANINSYQYKVGSDNYPDTAVSMPDIYNAEAFLESQRAFGHLGSVLFAPRSRPSEWWSVNLDSADNAAESLRLVMAYDLSRDSSIFSGVDVSVAPFTAEFGTSAAYRLGESNSTRYYHTWIFGNAILKIGQSGVSVLN